ncbi:(2,3-dihydroxybenzoyl)adenylate synthase [Clostridium saccharobutylicum]|uniref:2,3-dihydroxybenzoate-AMP ligase DhbE n=1 Tax=Clostridium saccharobutylicum DSM 13864 TaxID=1345695 RepID=U5MTA5_CLOSA|nr:AMP-binding protein [Clostridium saccharobutylicum]AGX42687.1 2,3-dihydroxybenzoate-AMP ligase DhbE [Clostridium saccharobutylicum DSM 13864]AQR89979.1 2,3-dihydroxybenzoate-AMP ligase [Clostridium saccharobutylicum]AQR99884.1 2,3-dihydroxybenzoate-AMP ligase [Clostridium saccharobutylicum]AQS09612.1 2,3-dihydroxybenzoate-AMP ligase [Clostridium saccharobutylicum]AQS13868.1 2,3-dihydroxybenzoate-AMP ligase [Clostridium saccharobutylicum]
MNYKKRYIKDLSSYENLEGWEKKTLGEHLKEWAESYGDKTAIIVGEEEVTYAELHQKSSEMAYGFLDLGIQKGDTVVVQIPNSISFVTTLFALAKIGAIPILVLPAYREAELTNIIKLAEPSAYIVADKYLGYDYIPMAEMLKNNYSCLKHVIVDGKAAGNLKIEDVKAIERELPKVDAYSTAILLLSGGTTGIPKLIPRTHADYIYNARMCAERCNLNEESVYLASLPVMHNFALSCPGLLGTLDKGATAVLCKNTSPDEILKSITEKKVTITGLVPVMTSVCMEMLNFDDEYDISSLKILQIGGAMLEDTMADKIIREWPCKLMQVFGTAEGLICFTSLDDPDEIIARCQGKPISPVDEMRIVDENDIDVENGEYGELISRGPYTIDGYFMAEEANIKSFTNDGFYRTGDRAMITKEGNLRMGGRLKEQINRAGEKIMPTEIEAYLCRHEDIGEVAIVGIPDEELGNRSCAFIMTEEDKDINLNDIHNFLRKLGVAQYKYPDQLENIESWPLTKIGKIDKKALAKMIIER